MSWPQYRADLIAAMYHLTASVGLPQLAEMAAKAGRLHFYGNGASATMASHMATDWTRRAKLPAFTYSDAAWLTATGNDAGYDRVFADTLALTQPTDLIVCISSSGRSPNILRLAEEAKAIGHPLITLTGMSADNPLKALGSANVFVPDDRYGIVESVHAAFLHAWLDCYCEIFLDNADTSIQSFSTPLTPSVHKCR